MRENGFIAPARLPSGRHDLPREMVVESQRKRILDAMAEVCSERGYAAVTVGDIVLRAGVSRGTFYALFRDKEQCLLAAGGELLAETMTVVAEAYNRGKPELESLRDGIGAILRLLAAQPTYAAVTFIDSKTSTPAAMELYRSGMRGVLALLGRSAKTTATTPSHAGRGALGGAEAIIRREIAAGRTSELPEVLPEVIYCAIVPFLGKNVALDQRNRAREALRRDAGEGVAAEA